MLLSDSWIVSIESPFYNLHTARSMKIFTFKEIKRKKNQSKINDLLEPRLQLPPLFSPSDPTCPKRGAKPTHLPGGTQSRRSVSHLFPVYQKWLFVSSAIETER